MHRSSQTATVRKKAVWGRSLPILTLLALISATGIRASEAQTTKADQEVQRAINHRASTRVIMRFDSAAERDAAQQRLQKRGLSVRPLDTDDAALDVSGNAVDVSSEIDGAARTSVNARVRPDAVSKAKFVRGGAIKLARQEFGNVASGIAVAVIDSGLQPHVDLPATRVRAWKDFVDGAAAPIDGCGHGTHVAGIIAGSGQGSAGQYAGVAPEVDLVVLRVLGTDCSGSTSSVIEALEWVARNAAKYNIRVVNMSLGHPVFEPAATDPMVQAVEKLARKGVLVVASAGNMGINPNTGLPGYGAVGVPCNAPSSVCVGALDTKSTEADDDDAVSNYSSRGPSRFDLLAKPDLVASGNKIVSLSAPGSSIFNNYPALQVTGGSEQKGQAPMYLMLSGTSMSSPVVAGSAALVMGVNPKLSAASTKMVLQFTARVLPKVDALTQGAGALNTLGAVQFASSINAGARRNTNWIARGAVTGSNEDANGQVVKWGQRVIYGNRLIGGNAALRHIARWEDTVAWGYDSLLDNLLWTTRGKLSAGDKVMKDFLDLDNVVWGNNLVWGDSIVWGFWADNVVWGFWDDNIVWGNVTKTDFDNIVWGNDWDNIVWGNCSAGNSDDDNIVWGNFDDNVVWGNAADDNIVWGNGAACKGKGK